MKDHRSLLAWQEARQVAVLVLRASRTHWRPWASAVFQQLQRASLSVPLNIAEGASFGPSATYRRHLGIAYGSAIETAELVSIIVDEQVIPPEAAREMESHSEKSRILLLGLLKRHRPME
jgi:four helix bundle protein